MTEQNTSRIDDISKYYRPAEITNRFASILFIIIAVFSIGLLYADKIPSQFVDISKLLFIILVISYFLLSFIAREYLVPTAERTRRKQMLSNSLGTPLTHERTKLYYNNTYRPSIIKIGANCLENLFFSKNIASDMLIKTRVVTSIYIIIWVSLFAVRQSDLGLLIIITQVVFSGEIIARWLSLETLKNRHSRAYEQLYEFFRHDIKPDSNNSIATILDSFADYESTKAASGVLLSSKTFSKLNPKLSSEWNSIRNELNMNDPR